jgi:hypothetical protein
MEELIRFFTSRVRTSLEGNPLLPRNAKLRQDFFENLGIFLGGDGLAGSSRQD